MYLFTSTHCHCSQQIVTDMNSVPIYSFDKINLHSICVEYSERKDDDEVKVWVYSETDVITYFRLKCGSKPSYFGRVTVNWRAFHVRTNAVHGADSHSIIFARVSSQLNYVTECIIGVDDVHVNAVIIPGITAGI